MSWLRKLRTSDNLSLLKVSKSIGISVSYLSYIEKGKRKPSVLVAKKLAKLYKIDWTKFFE